MTLLLTIDVETPQSPLLRGWVKESMLDPEVEGEKIGCSLILDELRRAGLRGVFFVNVYESALWGEDVLRDLCRRISAGGHEVGLHTHPACRYDRRRRKMFEYSAKEQLKIVEDGLTMLRDWLPDHRAVAHRAGAYGLDEHTLTALRRHGIRVDSSMFHSHPNCRVTWSKNAVVEREALFEIPVTGFFRRAEYVLAGVSLRKRTTFVKTDIDWASLDELKRFVGWAETGPGVTALFMHSYSLIRFDRRYSKPRRNEEKVKKLRSFLEWAKSQSNLQVRTMGDVVDGGALGDLARRKDDAPTFSSRRSLLQTARAIFESAM